MRKTRKEISKSEIRNVFRQIEKISSQRKPYFQVPQPQGIVEGWVTTGGSAKFDNTLISVSQWQIGQKS